MDFSMQPTILQETWHLYTTKLYIHDHISPTIILHPRVSTPWYFSTSVSFSGNTLRPRHREGQID